MNVYPAQKTVKVIWCLVFSDLSRTEILRTYCPGTAVSSLEWRLHSSCARTHTHAQVHTATDDAVTQMSRSSGETQILAQWRSTNNLITVGLQTDVFTLGPFEYVSRSAVHGPQGSALSWRKCRSKAGAVHTVKGVWGSEGVAPHILNLRNTWRWGVSFTVRSSYFRGKSPWGLLNRMLRGPHIRSVRFGEERHLLPLLGFEILLFGCLACRVFTVPTE